MTIQFNPDVVNGLFESAGAFFLARNCLTLYRDKMTKGVSKLSTCFFTSWGLWNLFYYPSLNQIWSFAGGVAIVLTNATWLALMIYYSRTNHSTLPTNP